jgi:hypothetical protein
MMMDGMVIDMDDVDDKEGSLVGLSAGLWGPSILRSILFKIFVVVDGPIVLLGVIRIQGGPRRVMSRKVEFTIILPR